jgi:hypothetical protein
MVGKITSTVLYVSDAVWENVMSLVSSASIPPESQGTSGSEPCPYPSSWWDFNEDLDINLGTKATCKWCSQEIDVQLTFREKVENASKHLKDCCHFNSYLDDHGHG